MDNKIKVMIVDDCRETRENVKKLLSFENRIEIIGEIENGEDAVLMAKDKTPDIILMDVNMPVKDGIVATQEISLSVPETAVIIMSVQSEQEYLRRAMAAGARDFLNKPFTSEDLIGTIIKTFEMQSARHATLNLNRKIDTEEIKSKVVTFFSTKGGVGKTTIAANLAVAIARETKKKVALLDFDFQFGDVSIMLNLSVKNTISDLVKDFSQVEEDGIDSYMISHFSGLRVLSAPLKPEYAEYITSSHIEKIIKALKQKYHFIIIDTPPNFHETVLTALDASDIICMISTLDLTSIKNIKLGFDVLESLRYPKDKLKLLLNKASEQFGITYKDFETTMKHSLWEVIPQEDQTVITSSNKGLPFIMTRSETKVAQSIFDLMDKLIEKKAEVKEEKATIRKFFGVF